MRKNTIKNIIENLGEGFYTYEYVRLDLNEPVYIGMGKNDRAFDLGDHKRRSLALKNLIDEIGIDNLAIVFLESGIPTRKTANEFEIFHINEEKYENGFSLFNGTDGGEGKELYGSENGMYNMRGSLSPVAKAIRVFKDGEFYKDYPSAMDFAYELGAIDRNDSIANAVYRLLKTQKQKKKGLLTGFSAHYI